VAYFLDHPVCSAYFTFLPCHTTYQKWWDW